MTEPRYVIVEFMGGPLDGFHNGMVTDQKMDLPESLFARMPEKRTNAGVYHIRVRGVSHYVYQWREAS